MKAMDVFSGLSWGDLSRYRIRHNQTIHKEKAAALDDRIRQVLAAERTYGWAVKTVEFCVKEAQTLSSDTAKYSKEAARLPELKQAAETLIRQHKERAAEARRREAQKADDTILSLSKAVRSGYWCSDVEDADKTVAALPREIRDLMKQLNLLQKLLGEAEQFRRSEEAEGRLRKLLNSDKKDGAWQQAAEGFLQPGSRDASLVRDKELLKKLDFEYLRVIRLPSITNYENLLRQIEGGLWAQAALRAQFHALDIELGRLGFDMALYIGAFLSRWQAAKGLVIKEEARLAEEQKARELEAMHQRNRAELKPYLDCLRDVEGGKASSQTVRKTFNALNKTVKKLPYRPEDYCPDFGSRWRTAEETVAQEQAIADEKKRQEEEAARIRQNKSDLQPYLNCLADIEQGNAAQASVRSNYAALNNALGQLGFDPEAYSAGFRTRWWAAAETVAREQAIADEKERQEQEAARLRRNQETLKPYIDCLETIEKRGAEMSSDRTNFAKLNRTVKNLGFSPDECCSGFFARWLAAESVVAKAQNMETLKPYIQCLENSNVALPQDRETFLKLDETVNKLGFNPDEYYHMFLTNWGAKKIRINAELENRKNAIRASQAKQARRENRKAFFHFALALVLSLGLSFLGIFFTAGLDGWWALPLMMTVGAFAYALIYRVDSDSMHELPNITVQILYGLFCVLFMIFFEQSIFSLILSMALVALVFNAYPRYRR